MLLKNVNKIEGSGMRTWAKLLGVAVLLLAGGVFAISNDNHQKMKDAA